MEWQLLVIVTDRELTVSTYVTLAFVLIAAVAVVVNAIGIWRSRSKRGLVLRAIGLLLFLGVGVMGFKRFRVDRSFLDTPSYTEGVTLGPCQVPLKGKGVRFRYEVDGVVYTNCNTFHPVPLDSVELEDGRYKVRYSPAYPEKGRMNFKKPVANDTDQ